MFFFHVQWKSSPVSKSKANPLLCSNDFDFHYLSAAVSAMQKDYSDNTVSQIAFLPKQL